MTHDDDIKNREMTPEDYIGHFNPDDNASVSDLKNAAKAYIRIIQSLPTFDNRRKAIACTKIEEAAMMAVKSIYS